MSNTASRTHYMITMYKNVIKDSCHCHCLVHQQQLSSCLWSEFSGIKQKSVTNWFAL